MGYSKEDSKCPIESYDEPFLANLQNCLFIYWKFGQFLSKFVGI